jgi:hypothetical protein
MHTYRTQHVSSSITSMHRSPPHRSPQLASLSVDDGGDATLAPAPPSLSIAAGVIPASSLSVVAGVLIGMPLGSHAVDRSAPLELLGFLQTRRSRVVGPTWQ